MSEGIPEGWRIASIGDISTKVGSGITPRGGSKVYTSHGVKFVRSQNVLFEGLSLDDIAFIPNKIHKSMSSTKLKEEDVLLNITGASIGRCTFVPKGFGEGNVNQHVCIIRPTADTDSRYLSKWISSDKGQNAIFTYQAGGNREGLNFLQIKSIHLLLPPLPEQQKIASILTSVDEVIGKTEAQIGKLQDLKKGMMQELLTKGIGHTEFKDSPVGRIPKGWNLIRLNNLSSGAKNAIVDGPFGSSINTKCDYIDKGIPVIRTVNIRPFSFIVSNLKFISEDTFERVKRSAVYPGDILLSKVGTIGYSCIFPNHLEKAILSTTGSCKITVNKDAINPVYLCYSLNFLKPYMDLIASEGVQPFLNMITIKSFLIRTPPLKEQEEIAEALESISETIKIHEIKLKKNCFIRKSLMQDLLTGKVRVKVN